MAQRHPHDDVVTLPPGHADPTSATYVPVELREAFASIDDDTEEELRRQLYVEVRGMRRTVAGRPVVLHPRDSEADFATALVILKTDEARRRVARAGERRGSEERSRRDHRCAVCQQVVASADSSGLVVGGVAAWCKGCRAEHARQEAAAHASVVVDGTSVADTISAFREQEAAP